MPTTDQDEERETGKGKPRRESIGPRGQSDDVIFPIRVKRQLWQTSYEYVFSKMLQGI